MNHITATAARWSLLGAYYQTGNNRVASVIDPVTGTMSYNYGLSGERRTTIVCAAARRFDPALFS